MSLVNGDELGAKAQSHHGDAMLLTHACFSVAKVSIGVSRRVVSTWELVGRAREGRARERGQQSAGLDRNGHHNRGRLIGAFNQFDIVDGCRLAGTIFK